MLELLATANELLEGTGDGRRYQSSIETLSRKTLGQLLNDFRKKADIRTDIDEQLDTGLSARNFVVHHFAAHLGDDLADESKVSVHQRTLYEKCSVVMAANDLGLSILESIGRLHSDRCNKMLASLKIQKTRCGKLRRIRFRGTETCGPTRQSSGPAQKAAQAAHFYVSAYCSA